jgi:alkylhydroperoxidase family enzyme
MTDERTIDPTEEQHRQAFDALQTAIMDGDAVAVTPIEVRRGAAERTDVERFAAYVDTIHDHAYQVSDRTVSDLRAAGASQDEVFEVTVSAAFGAARERLEAGLAALREATRAS